MRVFVAIELPSELKEKIYAFSQKITKRLQVKQVEEENLHLTLVFLGEISEKELDIVKNILSKIKVGEIKLKLQELQVIPSKTKPLIIWIKVGGQTGKLFSLYKQTVDNLLNQGFVLKKDNLDFRPHITIARVKGGGVRSLENEHLEGSFIADKVAIFESKLTPEGSIYSKIGEFEIK
jgi:2'-5' RNA ligase